MSKKINYTDDEIKLIQAISNPEDEIDVDEVARILVQKKVIWPLTKDFKKI